MSTRKSDDCFGQLLARYEQEAQQRASTQGAETRRLAAQRALEWRVARRRREDCFIVKEARKTGKSIDVIETLVDLVMDQLGRQCSRGQALHALSRCDYDVPDALMSLL